MHNYTWTYFNDQLSFIPSDFPEGNIRLFIDSDSRESRLSREEFEDFVLQIREKMNW